MPGGAAIATQLAAHGWPAKYVETMPFAGRRACPAFPNRSELAIIGTEAVAFLSAMEVREPLVALRDRVAACVHSAGAHRVTELAYMPRRGTFLTTRKMALCPRHVFFCCSARR